MRNIAYYNGEIDSIENIKISPLDRAFYFGDGIYDVATLINGKFFAWEDHIDRFFGNAKKLKINLTQTREEVLEICTKMASMLDSDISSAMVYFQASRGSAPRKHIFPENAIANLYINIAESKMCMEERHVDAITMLDNRFLMCDIKTLNLLPNVLAQEEAHSQDCYEAIYYRDSDHVTEGSHSALALLVDGKLVTHPLDEYILPSVTRKHYIEIATSLGIPVRERRFSVEEMMNADEVIIMSTTAICNVCDTINGLMVGGRDHENIKRILTAYRKKMGLE